MKAEKKTGLACPPTEWFKALDVQCEEFLKKQLRSFGITDFSLAVVEPGEGKKERQVFVRMNAQSDTAINMAIAILRHLYPDDLAMVLELVHTHPAFAAFRAAVHPETAPEQDDKKTYVN